MTIRIFNKTIEYSFYLLFLLVPLVVTSATSELFEFNKMWVTYGLTILIAASWIGKMILQRKILFCRTPLDIPIALFLASQIISTIFSLDSYVSFWGYYSRFNGGLLSTISYVILYYAFVSNFSIKSMLGDADTNYKRGAKFAKDDKRIAGPSKFSYQASIMVKRLLYVSLLSSALVIIWGLPSHFGHDFTCLAFRGTFDVSCWTDQFKPDVRMFSTLGQPNWLAAYLAVTISFSLAFLYNAVNKEKKSRLSIALYALLTLFSFLSVIYSDSQSGFFGLVIAIVFFFVLMQFLPAIKQKLSLRLTALLALLFFAMTFFVSIPIVSLQKFTFNSLTSHLTAKTSPESAAKQQQITPPPSAPGELGGTDSGKIRQIVWQGAINIWKDNVLFGTGVETFGYAYYKYRPAAHNLTSEWDYLYNKAHNEYLNYLATTGFFGLGSYLFITALFLWLVFKSLLYQDTRAEIEKKDVVIVIGLIAGYISILISNFFGFSVVIINIYFFLIPVFALTLLKKVPTPAAQSQASSKPHFFQWAGIGTVWLVGLYMIVVLIRYWHADTQYAQGHGADGLSQYQIGLPHLRQAVTERPDEPIFQDELANNNAVLAASYMQQKDATTASQYAQTAIDTINKVVTNHPNNVVYWKTRVRIYYTLGQIDQRFLPTALESVQKAQVLAPTDAKISYSLGVLLAQNGQPEKGIEVLNQTIILKPNFIDAWYALGLFYHQLAIDKSGKVVNESLEKKAVENMKYILAHLDSNNKQVIQALQTWGELPKK